MGRSAVPPPTTTTPNPAQPPKPHPAAQLTQWCPITGCVGISPGGRGPQMGQQATLCSPFANFNMVSVSTGMALGTVAVPLSVHCRSPVSPLCPFDLALNHKQTSHTYWQHEKLHTIHSTQRNSGVNKKKKDSYIHFSLVPLMQVFFSFFFFYGAIKSASYCQTQANRNLPEPDKHPIFLVYMLFFSLCSKSSCICEAF